MPRSSNSRRKKEIIMEPKPNAPSISTQAIEPSNQDEQIRCRAYELYEKRGAEDGHDLDDWLQAESELIQRTRAAAA